MQKTKTQRSVATAADLLTVASDGRRSSRPTRTLVRCLSAARADTSATAPETEGRVLGREIADHAQATMRTMHLGLGALGLLVARCSPEIADGTISAESVQNLGFLMAELGDLASECMRLTSECYPIAARGGEDA